MTPRASADQGGGVEAAAREIVRAADEVLAELTAIFGRFTDKQAALFDLLRAAPPSGLTPLREGRVPMCACGHSKLSHPFGLSGYVAFNGKCWGCDCEKFAPTSPVAGAPQEDQRTHEDKMRDVQNYVSAGGTWPPVEGGLTPDVERVVRAAGRLSPGVWRQLGKWLRTREGMGGPWDPDDPPVLAQIANEVDEIADALAALRVAPAASGEEKS